jgi:hypothetical protein
MKDKSKAWPCPFMDFPGPCKTNADHWPRHLALKGQQRLYDRLCRAHKVKLRPEHQAARA